MNACRAALEILRFEEVMPRTVPTLLDFRHRHGDPMTTTPEGLYREDMGLYVGLLQGLLHLEGWNVTIDWDVPLPDTTPILTTQAHYGRHLRVTFGPKFHTQPKDTQCWQLTNALLALHFAPLHTVTGELLEDTHSAQGAGVAESLRNTLTGTLDTFAHGLLPYLPKPPQKGGHLREVPQVP